MRPISSQATAKPSSRLVTPIGARATATPADTLPTTARRSSVKSSLSTDSQRPTRLSTPASFSQPTIPSTRLSTTPVTKPSSSSSRASPTTSSTLPKPSQSATVSSRPRLSTSTKVPATTTRPSVQPTSSSVKDAAPKPSSRFSTAPKDAAAPKPVSRLTKTATSSLSAAPSTRPSRASVGTVGASAVSAVKPRTSLASSAAPSKPTVPKVGESKTVASAVASKPRTDRRASDVAVTKPIIQKVKPIESGSEASPSVNPIQRAPAKQPLQRTSIQRPADASSRLEKPAAHPIPKKRASADTQESVVVFKESDVVEEEFVKTAVLRRLSSEISNSLKQQGTLSSLSQSVGDESTKHQVDEAGGGEVAASQENEIASDSDELDESDVTSMLESVQDKEVPLSVVKFSSAIAVKASSPPSEKSSPEQAESKEILEVAEQQAPQQTMLEAAEELKRQETEAGNKKGEIEKLGNNNSRDPLRQQRSKDSSVQFVSSNKSVDASLCSTPNQSIEDPASKDLLGEDDLMKEFPKNPFSGSFKQTGEMHKEPKQERLAESSPEGTPQGRPPLQQSRADSSSDSARRRIEQTESFAQFRRQSSRGKYLTSRSAAKLAHSRSSRLSRRLESENLATAPQQPARASPQQHSLTGGVYTRPSAHTSNGDSNLHTNVKSNIGAAANATDVPIQLTSQIVPPDSPPDKHHKLANPRTALIASTAVVRSANNHLPTPENATIESGSFVCSTVVIKGPHPIHIGKGCVIQPGAFIHAENGPISIGDGNVVEELALILNRSSEPLKIGDYNLIETHCSILDGSNIGDGNTFEARSTVGGVVPDGCIVTSNTSVSRLADIASGSVVFGEECKAVSASEDVDVILRKQKAFLSTVTASLLPTLEQAQSKRQGGGLPDIAPLKSK